MRSIEMELVDRVARYEGLIAMIRRADRERNLIGPSLSDAQFRAYVRGILDATEEGEV